MKMPVIFVGHGSPMNALENNVYTQTLKHWGEKLPTPQAILVVSAHWLTQHETLVQSSLNPKIIYDFKGFPQALYEIEYPAMGYPDMAQTLTQYIKGAKTTSTWGLDHGSWSVLKHLFPKANIPIFQLSIDFSKPSQFHYDMGKQLSYLREQGVLILGSGNIIHNLSQASWHSPINTVSATWAQQLDLLIKNSLDKRDIDSLINYTSFKHSSLGIRNPDHYYPLLYTLGAATGYQNISYPYEGFELGTLSMRCIEWN